MARMLDLVSKYLASSLGFDIYGCKILGKLFNLFEHHFCHLWVEVVITTCGYFFFLNGHKFFDTLLFKR